jgi:hypothetical protein
MVCRHQLCPSLTAVVHTLGEALFMRRWLAVTIAVVLTIGAGRTYADDTPGAGVVEVTIIPAGAGFVTAKNGDPNLGNHGFGTAVVYNINPVIGVEAIHGESIDGRC